MQRWGHRVSIDQKEIEQVVKAVLASMGTAPSMASPPPGNGRGVFSSLDDAVAAATQAQKALRSVAMRQRAIAAIRQAGEQYAQQLAEMAVEETGMGRVADKYAKNVAQARGTPGVECLQPQVLTGDNGLTLIENAAWGVVASVTPSTNPAATVINNAISMIAAGNSVVFAPHPAAKKVSQRAISLLNEAIVATGGPANLLVTVANADIETAQRLFKYPGIGLLVVTGGEAVVEAARKHTDKRLIAAGAGNPPVVVDESADIPRAARAIVQGASFDNNLICADEKVLIVVDSVAEALLADMQQQRAVLLNDAQVGQLLPLLLKDIDENGKGQVCRDWVGRDAAKIAAAIGMAVSSETRLLLAETEASHPFAVTEMMMPVLPVVRVSNVQQAIALAVKLEGGCHHTAAMHSRNIEHLDQMANAINTSIFVKNGPCIAGLGFGGEGWTSMTITTPTGEGVTSARTFVRLRRCVMVEALRIV
ncbi:acetaldehyde dehydrogenase [Serratia fonticola]|uniref:Acetaldehyde dehydrogenase n=1 Tax=Serratia fonticola TaxID=47917 RepID=A0A559TAH6_SERFO|nr:acetaldehyde dehydrogenase [Serratia fonticola]TQI97064.1 acetaldehyde dehydrogenase [Serratia fonticola]TVZ71560.1 acetaldehyde dehydrogenase [Serratia fonticola]